MNIEEVNSGHHNDNQHPVAHPRHHDLRDAGTQDGQAPLGHIYDSELHRLKSIEAEYKLTVRVLAVLAEQLLKSNWAREQGLSEIAISDEVLLDCPEIIAWRELNEPTGIVIKIRR